MNLTITNAQSNNYMGILPLNALNSFTLFDLFDDALADMLCLETYTHGTSPRNYSQIIKNGANPALGGDVSKGEGAFHLMIGEDRSKNDNADWDSKGKFYVFKDDCFVSEAPACLARPFGSVVKKCMPRVYATVTTVGEMHHRSKQSSKIWSIASGFFLSIFVPSLKFRFSPQDRNGTIFQDDKTFIGGKIAAYTEQPIHPQHIGMLGTLTQGTKGPWLERIRNHPTCFIGGMVKLITTIALAALVAVGMMISQTVFIVAATLLLYETVVCVGRIAVPLLFFNPESSKSNEETQNQHT